MLQRALPPCQLAAPQLTRPVSRRACFTVASLASPDGVVTEPKTKISFPRTLLGQRCLGVGVRSKQLLGPLAVNVYCVALYARLPTHPYTYAGSAAGDAVSTLLAGDCPLTLCLTFARSVTPEQFLGALNAELATRSTDAATLESFSAYFRGKSLDTGATVLLSLLPSRRLDVSLMAPQALTPPAAPGASFASPAFARALFDVYVGENSIVPDAKKAWAAGASKPL